MGRVLLVEDESLIAMLAEDMLVDLGHEVGASVATLPAGLQAAAEQPFDVAVLDVNLRGDMSYPIAEVLRRRQIPFVFVSGYAEGGIDPRFKSVPALNKPYTLDGLERVIQQALVTP